MATTVQINQLRDGLLGFTSAIYTSADKLRMLAEGTTRDGVVLTQEQIAAITADVKQSINDGLTQAQALQPLIDAL